MKPKKLPGAEKRHKKMVREERLELSRIAPLDPKSSAYANFATLAQKYVERRTSTALRQKQAPICGKPGQESPHGAWGKVHTYSALACQGKPAH